MTILSQIPNGASNKDIRETINEALSAIQTLASAIAALQNGNTGGSTTLTIDPLLPLYSDSFDGDGLLNGRPNWVVQSGEEQNWSTAGGSLRYTKMYGQDSTVLFGPALPEQVWTLEYNTAVPNDEWDNNRQYWYAWYKDVDNFVKVSIGLGTGKVVNGVVVSARVAGVDKAGVNFYPTVTPTQSGKIHIVLGSNTVRVMINGAWAGRGGYSYPFDRASYDQLSIPTANRTGKAGWLANTWTYARGDSFAVTPLVMTIDEIDDFVGEDTLTSKGGTATLKGTVIGTPVKWGARIVNAKTGVVLKDWYQITDVVVSGNNYTAKVFLPVGGPYTVSLAWIGSDGKARVAHSTRVLSGIMIFVYGQSNALGRSGATNDGVKGDNYASYSVKDQVQYDMPEGHFASANNNYPASHSTVIAREVATRLKVPVAVTVCGANGTPIDFLAVGGGGWDGFVARRAFVKGVIRAVVWDQGEGDADGTVSFKAGYTDTFRTKLLPGLRTSAGNDNLKVLIAEVGNYPYGGLSNSTERNDNQRAQLKSEYLAIIAAEPNVSFSSSKLGANHGNDAYHYNASGIQEVCRRDGISVAKMLAPEISALYNVTTTANYSGRGPLPTGLSVSGSTATITVNLNGATAITGPTTVETFSETRTAPTHANSFNGYQFSTDNFTTILPVTSMSTVDNKLVFQLASAPSGTLKVRSMWGSSYDDRTLFYGTYSDTTPIPVAPINSPLSI